jgi:hypothetical protein
MPEVPTPDNGEGDVDGDAFERVREIDDAIGAARLAGEEARAYWYGLTSGKDMPVSVARCIILEWMGAEDDGDDDDDE